MVEPRQESLQKPRRRVGVRPLQQRVERDQQLRAKIPICPQLGKLGLSIGNLGQRVVRELSN